MTTGDDRTPGARAAAADGWLRAERPLVVSHRGQPVEVPEQTMESYRLAIELGGEMIEADAQLSRDDRLVLMHDLTVDRTTDGSGRVIDMSWTELQGLDAGGWFDQRFRGLRIPPVEELVDLAASAGIGLCLEAKGETAAEASRIAVRLAQLIVERGALAWAFVSSFHHPAVEAARAVAPELLIAPERLPDRGPLEASRVLEQALALGTPVVQHRWELLTAEVVDLLHEQGIAVWAWNTNDERAVRAALGAGADALMGDDTRLLLRMRDAWAAGLGVGPRPAGAPQAGRG